MPLNRYQYIEGWTEEDLLHLPSTEDGLYEYKGSRIEDDNLGNELSKAASAFWNSGGGVLVVGVDKRGKIDGGITELVRKQNRRDWVDQHIRRTEPPGTYWVRLISGTSSTSLIKPGHVVVVVGFEESVYVPHMASDYKYYIRAGAHSNAASHFLVEAIRARQVVRTPLIRAVLKRSERKSRIVELVVLVLNEAVALDLEITFNPLPKVLADNFADRFPIYLPLIDHTHPFSIELYYWGERSETFGSQPVELSVSYKDLTGQSHLYTQVIDGNTGIDPMTMGETDLEKIEKAIKEISQKVHYLNSTFEKFYGDIFHLPDDG